MIQPPALGLGCFAYPNARIDLLGGCHVGGAMIAVNNLVN
eukprot:SAG31_NODE_44368_length_263_cov_0.628049_1_plen_39_part_01